MSTLSKTITLFGLKASRKSVHGQKLAKQFEMPFYDTDYVIQKMTGSSPRDIYIDQGVAAFMQAEEDYQQLYSEWKDAQSRIINLRVANKKNVEQIVCAEDEIKKHMTIAVENERQRNERMMEEEDPDDQQEDE